ncbi:MAG: glycoside hydrolase family 38 C-terminal domain-containing protein [Candidatus Bathyarchaeia archaeon]|nr:alpha-mannosidase [Candidatus Bathyarchaeota archaeon]
MKGRVFMVGHAHIDLSWLWTRAETILDIIPRTFRSVIDLAERYGIVFSQSTAQIYKWVEEYYPELFDRIKDLVKRGLWEIVGGSWDEYSPLLVSGESLVRQYLYGKRYFMDRFGIDVSIAWLPDSFGFPWTLPQILRKSGLRFFMTHKLKWQVERNNPPIPFPYHVFWWRSPDGSVVLAYHTIGSYNEDVSESKISNYLDVMKSKHGLDIIMYVYGRGDHGGGPAEDMVVKVLDISRRRVFDLKFSKAEDFFDELERIVSRGVSIPIVNDELYVKTHRGTYTTEAIVKVWNRRCENLLLNLEKFSSIAYTLGYSYPYDDIRNLWELLLLNQVHDNLDGTSIEQAYQDGVLDYMHIMRRGSCLLSKALNNIASRIDTSKARKPLIVFNPLPWPRTDIVEVDGLDDVSIVDSDGNLVPIQRDVESGRLMFIARGVPGLGYRVYDIIDFIDAYMDTDLKIEGFTMENSFIKVVVDPYTGCVSSIYDKINGLELIDRSKGGNFLELFVDKPPNAPLGEPAWNIYLGSSDKPRLLSIEIIESGPVRARVRIRKSFGRSLFTLYVSLYAYTQRVDFEIRAYWDEEYRFAKIGFSPSFKAPYATYEIAYGVIQRYTHVFRENPGVNLEFPPRGWEDADMLKFEVSAHTWVDLSDPDGVIGFTIVNDGRYGFSYDGGTIWISFLRAANRARPLFPLDWTDRSSKPWVGEHRLRYALYPHRGGWRALNPTRLGMEFNNPLIPLIIEKSIGDLPSKYCFMEVYPSNVVVTAVKRSEDNGDIIVRLFESEGRVCEATLNLWFEPRDVHETDMVEWDRYVEPRRYRIDGKILRIPMNPFEIKTLRLKL